MQANSFKRVVLRAVGLVSITFSRTPYTSCVDVTSGSLCLPGLDRYLVHRKRQLQRPRRGSCARGDTTDHDIPVLCRRGGLQ